MRERKIYALVAIVLAITIYGYDFYLKGKEQTIQIENGKQPKENTQLFFLPTSTTGQIIHHNHYSLSYSEKHEQAEWVAYELKKEHLKNFNFKRPYFEMDPLVSTGSAKWENYKNSGYDRGHLCPAGDRRFSPDAYNETFLTSNIAPQDHNFNSGIWNRLEQKTRYWASKHDGVFVITGGILKDGLKHIGKEQVSVPNDFFKILLDYDNGNPKMIAFLLKNEDSKLPLKMFEVAVDSIESLTGIDFFEQFDDVIENKLESDLSFDKW